MRCHYPNCDLFLIRLWPYKYSTDSKLAYKFAVHVFFVIFEPSKKKPGPFCGAIVILRMVCPVVKCGVWTVRGPELTWIVFQVGQHPWIGPGQPQKLAQGCGSETTSQATGTHSAALHTRESVQIAHRQAVWWGFPRSGWESRGWSTVKGNILFHLLLHRGVLEWKVHCSTHKIWFCMSASGRHVAAPFQSEELTPISTQC